MLLISMNNLTQSAVRILEAFGKHMFGNYTKWKTNGLTKMRILKTICLLHQGPAGLERVKIMVIHSVTTLIENPKNGYEKSKLNGMVLGACR